MKLLRNSLCGAKGSYPYFSAMGDRRKNENDRMCQIWGAFVAISFWWGGSVNDLSIELSCVREENEIDKVDLTNTIKALLGEVRNLTEHQQVGESKRRNLETKLERLGKFIQGGNMELIPRKSNLWSWAK